MATALRGERRGVAVVRRVVVEKGIEVGSGECMAMCVMLVNVNKGAG